MISIRKAIMSDYEYVVKILSEIHKIHYCSRPDFYKEFVNMTIENYGNLLEDSNKVSFLAVQDETVVGLCMLKESINLIGNKVCFLEVFSVDEEHQNKGIGIPFMNLVISELKKK